jgi:hypothetical protein
MKLKQFQQEKKKIVTIADCYNIFTTTSKQTETHQALQQP